MLNVVSMKADSDMNLYVNKLIGIQLYIVLVGFDIPVRLEGSGSSKRPIYNIYIYLYIGLYIIFI